MKIRPKDHIYWEIVYESQQEAEAVKDYLDQILLKGVPDYPFQQVSDRGVAKDLES